MESDETKGLRYIRHGDESQIFPVWEKKDWTVMLIPPKHPIVNRHLMQHLFCFPATITQHQNVLQQAIPRRTKPLSAADLPLELSSGPIYGLMISKRPSAFRIMVSALLVHLFCAYLTSSLQGAPLSDPYLLFVKRWMVIFLTISALGFVHSMQKHRRLFKASWTTFKKLLPDWCLEHQERQGSERGVVHFRSECVRDLLP